eukprot:15452821-Alexandrium_andersonii.AAC.1
MLASPEALKIASNLERQDSGRLAPAAGLFVRTRARFKQPAAHPCSSRSSRVRFTRSGAAAARGGRCRGPSAASARNHGRLVAAAV